MKILVGLSGGVDSAVAAYLLLEQGHEVIGGFMKNYIEDTGTCTTREDAESAIAVAKHLGIDLMVFDFQKEYKERILNYIFEGYQKGITPNPDILCNNLIKFDLFLEEAVNLGFDKIATGHYVRVLDKGDENGQYKLLRGKDHHKDQTYFLSGLNQKQLSKSLFPVGELKKTEVRKIAKKIKLPNADRKDSQGLCFVGNIPIKDFLMKKLPVMEGKIMDENGNVLGKHDGAWFFTIGQNRGLKLPHKAYVYKIDVENNIVFASKNKESKNLTSKYCHLKNWHWIGEKYTLPIEVEAKIRYRQEIQSAELKIEDGKFFVEFDENQWAIASGQSVVAYVGEECVGSGVIG